MPSIEEVRMALGLPADPTPLENLRRLNSRMEKGEKVNKEEMGRVANAVLTDLIARLNENERELKDNLRQFSR